MLYWKKYFYNVNCSTYLSEYNEKLLKQTSTLHWIAAVIWSILIGLLFLIFQHIVIFWFGMFSQLNNYKLVAQTLNPSDLNLLSW